MAISSKVKTSVVSRPNRMMVSRTDLWYKSRGAFISQQINLEGVSRALPIRQQPASQRRQDSYPLASGDTYRSVCHWLFDETGHNDWEPSMVQSGDLIFAKTDMLDMFFRSRHPLITKPYVLITSNSDHPSPGTHSDRLNDTNLFAWFGQNGDADHPKFHPLPIGFPNQEWDHGNFSTLKRQASSWKSKTKRPWLLYINVGTGSNPRRQKMTEYFKLWDQHSVRFAERGTHEQYLEDMTNSRFVLSPPGNGIDCHRTWEATLMGAIPVILPSFSFGELAQSAPVLIVDDFQNLTCSQLIKYQYPSPDVSGVFADYWFKLFDQANKQAKMIAAHTAN